MQKFTKNIISFSLKNHVLVFFLTGLLAVVGVISYMQTPIEAFRLAFRRELGLLFCLELYP